MGENIEVKDVQRTEYLDKNGLDMLWAKVKENTHNQVEIERNRAVAKENSIVDTKADKSALDNYVLSTTLAEYAKKTDIPEVDTSDFVSKTTTDAQIINSTLGIVGGGIQIVDYIENSDPVSLGLASSALEFNGSDRSTITLNASDVNSNNGSRIIIEAYNENPQITLYGNLDIHHGFSNNLTITNEGISNTDNNANHVYATDGSIADLTQYALSSTLAALEQKVTANTTTIEGKQDAGSYIPFDESDKSNYKINRPLKYENYLGTFSFLGNKIFSISRTNKDFSITDSGINYNIGRMGILLSTQGFFVTEDGNFDINISSATIQLGKTANPNVKINANGVKFKDRKNTEVPVADGSGFADLNNYVLKSVYDKKIAALEARIAALEAKHAEAAA